MKLKEYLKNRHLYKIKVNCGFEKDVFVQKDKDQEKRDFHEIFKQRSKK